MSEDFYCDEAVSGRTPVEVVAETDADGYVQELDFW